MTWGFINETSDVLTSTSSVTGTCWVTVSIIVGILIFILIINDLSMKKQNKKRHNNKFYEEDEEYQYKEDFAVKN